MINWAMLCDQIGLLYFASDFFNNARIDFANYTAIVAKMIKICGRFTSRPSFSIVVQIKKNYAITRISTLNKC